MDKKCSLFRVAKIKEFLMAHEKGKHVFMTQTICATAMRFKWRKESTERQRCLPGNAMAIIRVVIYVRSRS